MFVVLSLGFGLSLIEGVGGCVRRALVGWCGFELCFCACFWGGGLCSGFV